MTTDTEMMTPRELAARLRIKVRTLHDWRKAGAGPEFVKLGNCKRSRIRYRVAAVAKWLEDECTQVSSEVA